MIKGVIFDCDGVLIDSKMLHFEAWKKFWAKRGIEHSYDDFKKNFGRSNFDIFGQLYKEASEEEIKRLSDEKEEFYREIAAKNLKPVKGTVNLLKSLRQNGFKMAVATSAPGNLLNFIMDQLGIEEYFSAIVTASDVKHSKPDPEIFLNAAEKLGLKPNECIVIEDAIHGIEAAKKAGMMCIAVETSHFASELRKADLIRKDLSEVSIGDIRGLG